MDQDKSAADHWQFSLAVYTREGVAGHCLELQNRLGLDVNVLLLMLWAAGQWGDAPTAQQIAEADSTIGAWRREIVEPLRQLRTRLRQGPAPAPDAMTDVLRENIKRLELDAERMQQEVLAQWVKEQAQTKTGAGHNAAVKHPNGKPPIRDEDDGLANAPTPITVEVPGTPQPSEELADTAENARQLAVLEQTAVRVVAHFEAASASASASVEAGVGTAAGSVAAAQTADPWLALQHAHQVVLAALAVLASE